uniref:Small glutamine-rich tetratricopeptide repeat-containing protein alpha n=1 Tax=Aceria tosichella TaxID=561515 RepID=A0A6G1SJI1_9ACAR
MSSANDDSDEVKELASKVQQFLSHQVESNTNLNDAAKESLTVATECIEQAYGIQRKAASNELLNIYRTSKSAPSQQQANNGSNSANNQQQQQQQQLPTDPAQLISNLASTLFSQVGSGFVNTVASAAAGATTGQPQQQHQSSTTERSSNSSSTTNAEAPAQPSAPPKPRRKPTESETMAAESFKNQGNDCMKQEKFKEAYDYYTQAIDIDNSNAIYYSNRAAASSKLGNHQAALKDCQESIDIDPNYSKAYGRMALAYASLENHQKAKETYIKALELDPTNESYRNNLAIAEEKLAEAQNAGGAGAAAGQPGANMVNVLRSMMNNPDVMSMAMRSLQDPRVQSMFGLGGGAPGGAPGAGGAPR